MQRVVTLVVTGGHRLVGLELVDAAPDDIALLEGLASNTGGSPPLAALPQPVFRLDSGSGSTTRVRSNEIGRPQATVTGPCLADHVRSDRISVYRVTEVIGTSPDTWEAAARNAVETAASTVRELRVAEVVRQDVTIENGQVTGYRVRLAISFKYESTS